MWLFLNLLKYDSSQGKYEYADAVEAGEDYITVNGKKITIYKEPDASKLPWGELGVDVVLECTGFYTSKAKAEAHIKAGARKVVISAPAGNDLPTIVYNVNHETLKPEDTVISAASCTRHPTFSECPCLFCAGSGGCDRTCSLPLHTLGTESQPVRYFQRRTGFLR